MFARRDICVCVVYDCVMLHTCPTKKICRAHFCRVHGHCIPPCEYLSATLCNTLQHTATSCNTLQHNSHLPHSRPQHSVVWISDRNPLQPTATHCNPLQSTATHCDPLQHTATRCNTPQHTVIHCSTLQHNSHLPHSRPQHSAVQYEYPSRSVRMSSSAVGFLFLYLNKNQSTS